MGTRDCVRCGYSMDNSGLTGKCPACGAVSSKQLTKYSFVELQWLFFFFVMIPALVLMSMCGKTGGSS